MELFKVNATIEKLNSEKKGTDYIVVKVPIASDYTMTIFPKDAEKSIITKSDFLNTAKTDVIEDKAPSFDDFA